MTLMGNALIDETYFTTLWDGAAVDSDKLDIYINAVSALFETFCNRPLKERSFTYVEAEEDADNGIYYMEEYTVFDGPNSNVLWLPTYPIDSVSYLEISGTEVTAATTYQADSGYVLYNKTGKIVYDYLFDFPYRQNVKIKWKGGYKESSSDYAYLQYLCYLTIKDNLNAPKNMTFKEETIGNYSYKLASNEFAALQGLSPKVFVDLKRYRREAFA